MRFGIPASTFDHFPCHPLLISAGSISISISISIYNRFTTASAAAQMDRAPPQAGEQPHKRSSAASSAMASSTSGHMGKHRMLAAISFLNQEIQIMQALTINSTSSLSSFFFLFRPICWHWRVCLFIYFIHMQDELVELETIGGVSTVCPE